MSAARTEADEQTVAAGDGVALRPSTRLAGLQPYRAQKPMPGIDLRLDANEGRVPSAPVLDALQHVSPEGLQRYPDASSLEASIADRLGVNASRVVVTNGGDDAIDRVCRASLEPGRVMLTHSPGFVMIPQSARLAGGSVRTVEWLEGAFPEASLASMIAEDTGLVALVSPNNPTGRAIDTAAMLAIARAAARVGALTLADLAYIEFADEDPTEVLLAEPNVVVVRTLSKAFGLAGARVGYAVAQPDVARWLRTAGGPYPVSAVSLAVAGASLASGKDRLAYMHRVREERAALADLLAGLGARPLASQANFVMASFHDAAFVHAGLAAMGILVRSMASGDERAGWLRITLPGDADDFRRLCNALCTILAPQSIIIDARRCALSAIIDPDAAKRLAGRASLEVLTTLDRGAVARDIGAFGIGGCCKAIEADHLGGRHAWVLCGNDDDAQAFRTLGLLPITFNADSTNTLRAAGLADLEGLLP